LELLSVGGRAKQDIHLQESAFQANLDIFFGLLFQFAGKDISKVKLAVFGNFLSSVAIKHAEQRDFSAGHQVWFHDMGVFHVGSPA